jgi:hypothetical protein
MITPNYDEAIIENIEESFIERTKDHVFTVEFDGDNYNAVYPEPLAGLYSGWLDEFSAWSAIMRNRLAQPFGKRWAIENPLECAKCLWSALGNTPVNDDNETEEGFLHFESGTDCHDIWHWFEDEFNVSVATDLMNLK